MLHVVVVTVLKVRPTTGWQIFRAELCTWLLLIFGSSLFFKIWVSCIISYFDMVIEFGILTEHWVCINNSLELLTKFPMNFFFQCVLYAAVVNRFQVFLKFWSVGTIVTCSFTDQMELTQYHVRNVVFFPMLCNLHLWLILFYFWDLQI